MENPCTRETHWEKAAKTKMGNYLTKIEAGFISGNVNLEECEVVMDVGAEAGRFSILAADKNVEVIGIDIELYGLKRIRLKSRQIKVIRADARNIPLKDGVLDAIFMVEVLDYIPELETVMTECRRTLKPESSLILSFGNKSSPKAKLRKLRGKSYLHSYCEVRQTLEKLKFKTARKAGYNWLPFGRTSENPLIPMLARAEKLFGLRKFPRYSPWVIMHALKPK